MQPPARLRRPGQETAMTQSGGKKAGNMEKFKETVMKRLITAQSAPFSEAYKTFLEERVSRFVSLLHTPDHPPYAWMIERALRKLNKTGGSSEDSISKFIRKEYDDLPWSHSTMLKYHIDRLCQCGELVLTHGQKYLLASATSEGKISRKCRRRSVKRKKGWVREIMQSKRSKKVHSKKSSLPRDDNVGLLFSQQEDLVTSNLTHDKEECSIGENKQLTQEDNGIPCMQQNDQLISKEVHEHEVCVLERNKHTMLNSDEVELFPCQEKCLGASKDVNEEKGRILEGSKQQKSKSQGRKGIVKLSVADNIGANDNSDVPFNIHSGLMIIDGENSLPKFRMQMPTAEPTAGRIDCVYPDGQPDVGLEKTEDNHMELATPVRPPGFDSVTYEQSSELQPQTAVSSKLTVHPEKLNQNCAPGLSDAQGKSSEPEVFSIEESLPAGGIQRYSRRTKRLSRDKTLSLPSAEMLDGYPGKPKFCDEDMVHSEGQTSVERQREKQVAQGETSRVLRSQTGKCNPHEGEKPENPVHLRIHQKVKPRTEVLNELTHTIHQTEEDMVLQGLKSEPSKLATGEKFLKHDLRKRQLGFRGQGRPSKSSMPAKAIADELLVGDVAPPNDQNQQRADYSLQPPEKLDVQITEKLLLKPTDNHQLRTPRRGRPPKPKEDANVVVKSSFKHNTRYQGRGRPRFTDRRDW